MGFGSPPPPPPPPLPSRKEKTQASLFPPSSFHLLSERTHSLSSSSNNTTLPPLPTHTFPNVNCPLPSSPHTHNCLFVLACRFLLQRFPLKKKNYEIGGNVLSACSQEKAQKNRRQLADIFRFSSLSPPPKNHLPRRHPQYPKGLFGTDIESGRELLLPPPCMWVALDFSIFLLGKDDVVCSYTVKRGRCIPAAFLQAKRECVPFSVFFSASRPRVGKVNFPSVTPSSPLLVVCGSEDRCRKTIKPLISPLSLSLSFPVK